MKAIGIKGHGDVEVLESMDLPDVEPGHGEVRVAVRAVALNHLDLWVRKGGPAFRHLNYPHCLGSDIAGTVDAVGPGVNGIESGQRCIVAPGIGCGQCTHCLAGDDNLCRYYKIYGENTSGGYRQFMNVPARSIAPYPGELSFTEAAAANLTFLTAWQMLVEKAHIGPGDIVLIHGAGSGVGVAAIQIAKLFDAFVIATAGANRKLDAAQELGADVTINYKQTGFVKEVIAKVGKRAVDVVFEHVGGETFEKSLLLLRNGGKLVTCGATAGPTPNIDLRHVFFRQLQVLGSTMGRRATVDKVIDLVGKGRLTPIIERVLPLQDAREAHKLLESRNIFGKVVLEVPHD